jgi:2-polyprenyl-6-methoxyphenol hydroxylase-like FAD-dependent oxidoreductase
LSEEDGETAGFREGDDVEIVRGELVEILLQAVADVSPRFNTYATKFNQQADGVAVTFNTGETEIYDLVIAADGLHSSTRKQVFGESRYQMKDLGAYISVCSVPNYLQLDHAEISFERQQKHLNINSDQVPHIAQVGFMFRTDRQLADFENEQTQKAFIREIYQDMGWETNHILTLMDDSDDLYFDAITQVKMSDWTHGRVALLGDAGYCASPLSGQGTSLALVGAYILAGELQAANGDHQKAFQKYNQLMRPFVDANQAFGAWVGETFLLQQEMSKEASEKRTLEIMNRLRQVANAINLPSYN